MKNLARPLAALVIVCLLAPSVASATDSTTFSNGSTLTTYSASDFSLSTGSLDNTQAGMSQNNAAFSGSSGSTAKALSGAAGTCTFNSMLSELLSSFLTYLLQALFSDLVTEAPLKALKVPVDDSTAAAQGKALRAKEVCAWAPYGFCVLPSLDSIAFCFINQIIDYIGKATVEWIKTGFQGSPAFIDDPEKFFTNAVDQAAGNLLNQISDGLLCEPWRAQIQVQLLNEHTSSFQNTAQGCKLSEVSDKWESFASGDSGSFDWDLQYAYTQNPYNNPLGSLIETRTAFNTQLAATQNSLDTEVKLNQGWLNVKDPETGRITTPGRVIESQLNRRLGNAENRLLIADEFDEIINALVNELVKLALSELFDGDGDSESEDGALEYEYTVEETEEEEDSGDEEETTDPDGGTDGEGTDLVVTCTVADGEIDEGDALTATANVTGRIGTIYFNWIGDTSQSSSGATSTATYDTANEGSVYPEVWVSDDDWDGELEKITCPRVQVHEDYAVSCTVTDTSIEDGESVTYTATVTGADGDIEDYDWGGAASGAGATISETYGSAGTYSVHVEIADEEGNREQVDCPTVTVTN